MNKKILLSVLIIFSLCLFSGCSFNFFGNKQPNSPEQNNISATDGATSACAAMADGTLTGDRQADIKSACCFKTNLESGACNPGRLVFNTPDLGPVTASVSQGSKTCVVTLTYGNADQIIDPDKKFFANKFIGYSFLLTDLKAVNDPAGCEKNLDLNAFYNFPDDILNKYLGLSSIILGNLDRTKVNALREKQIEKNCSGLSSGALKGDGGAVDKNLACCYQQSFDDGFCFPYQLVFKTADLGKVTLSISSDGENCAARLDFGAAAQITDPAKKFYANKNIIYNKKLSDAKSFGNESFCQEQVNPSSDDFKKFYNLPATLINQYWGSQATAGSGNLIQGLVNSCSAVKNATINGDGSFDDSKGRCCLLENLYLNNCQPFQAAYQTTDLGKVILSISKSKNNCLAKVSYGSADQIADQSKKSFANKTITKIYTPADLKTFGDTQDKTGVLLCQQIFSVYANTSRGDLDLILNGYLSNQPGFSGNLAKSSEVKTAAGDLTGATTKARDHARVSYINSLRQALNDYYMNNGQYPPALSFGQPLKDPAGKNYLPQ
ncbi:MAG TPA: hypothetical protein VMD74_05265, partial [Candidatus Methylomirabilis sp.]|nr:hypothetical protein [Candidatus Methylomirabilis sp.]